MKKIWIGGIIFCTVWTPVWARVEHPTITTESSSSEKSNSNSPFSENNQTNSKKRVPKVVSSEAGLNIPGWGIAIDAVYDPRLDNLVPGYKMLNVILTNRGAATINLDPEKDHWEIKDNLGKTHTGINHLRQLNEKLWFRLPQAAKEALEYPQAVRIGNSAKIDLFFPSSTELSNFREINWKSSHFKKEFNLMSVFEKNLDEPETSSVPTLPTEQRAMEKYDTSKPINPERIPKFDPNLDPVTIPMD